LKAPKDSSALKFESVMEDLQRIVSEMESGSLPLDDLIVRYEEGMKLVKISRDKLAIAEQKVEILTKNQSVSTAPDVEVTPKPQKKDDISLF